MRLPRARGRARPPFSGLRRLGPQARHAQTSHDGNSRRDGDGADNPGPVHENPAYLPFLAGV